MGQLRQQEEHLHGGHFIAFCVTLGSVTRFLYLVKKGMDADLIGSLVGECEVLKAGSVMCSILLLLRSCMPSRLHMHAQFGEPVSYRGFSYAPIG